MKTLVQNLLKSLPIIAIVAAMAYMAVSGFAMAQQGTSMSCDVNQGTSCAATCGAPASGSTAVCIGPDAGGDYECGCIGTYLTLPNDAVCEWNNGLSSEYCASEHCLPDAGASSWGTITAPAYGWCCAWSGQVLNNDTYISYASPGVSGNPPLACLAPGDYNTRAPEEPYHMGCFDGGFSRFGQYLLPSDTPGSAHVCSGYFNSHLTPQHDTADLYETWCDSGTSPLGGLQHLMKSDFDDMHNLGYDQCVPLGWNAPPISDNLVTGTDNLGPAGVFGSAPDYFCQQQFYLPDGGWALEYAGANHVDLMECGGSPSDVFAGTYFPCCGQQHDAGPRTVPNLCQPDVNGVSHCGCITDGYACDRPQANAYYPAPNITRTTGMGECCSSGLSVQVYDAGTGWGQGWCRPDAYVLEDAGIPGSPGLGLIVNELATTGSVTPPGWCNCLPTEQICASASDCCKDGLNFNLCVADGGPSICCIALGNYNCYQNNDCCGATGGIYPVGGVAGNVCLDGQCNTCVGDGGTCYKNSDCCGDEFFPGVVKDDGHTPEYSGEICTTTDVCQPCGGAGGSCLVNNDCCGGYVCDGTTCE